MSLKPIQTHNAIHLTKALPRSQRLSRFSLLDGHFPSPPNPVLYRAFRKPDLSMKSMHNEAVMLKTLLKWAKQRKYIKENPLAETKFERRRVEPHGGPTQAQMERILRTARDRHPRRTQYAVLAFTGMRSGELQRLRVEDIDFEGNWIHIVSREGAETKTGYSRKVPIHAKLKPLLQALPKTGPWLFTAPPSRKYPQGATG